MATPSGKLGAVRLHVNLAPSILERVVLPHVVEVVRVGRVRVAPVPRWVWTVERPVTPDTEQRRATFTLEPRRPNNRSNATAAITVLNCFYFRRRETQFLNC